MIITVKYSHESTISMISMNFELMFTRRAKTYSSFFSQTVSLPPAISLQFILGVCAAAEDHRKSIKKPLF